MTSILKLYNNFVYTTATAVSRTDWEDMNISPDKRFIGPEFRHPKLPPSFFVASSPTEAHKKMALSTNYVDVKTKKGWSPLLAMTYPAHRQTGPSVSTTFTSRLGIKILDRWLHHVLICRMLVAVLPEVLLLPIRVSENSGKLIPLPS